MAKTLNWGIISTANINKAVIPPLGRSQRNRLLGVASRDEARARAYAQEWSIPRYYGSYEALLADPEIDVVYISLPNSLHAEWTVHAAQAGKHVLCEKPLAITLEQVDAMIDAAQRNRVVMQEAFMYRHHPQTLQVQEIVNSGVLGAVRVVRGSFSFRLGWEEDIRLTPELLGGSLWDVGCYPVSYARTVLRMEPAEVYGWQVVGPSGVDLFFAGTLKFSTGALAQIDSGFRPSERAQMEIIGEEASLSIPTPYKPVAEEPLILKRGGAEEVIPVPAFDLYSGEIENMADAILEGVTPRIPLSDSRGNVATLLALYASARTGKAVRV